MHIQFLEKIYLKAKSVGAVRNSAEFSEEYLGKYTEYYCDNIRQDHMVQPWTVLNLLSTLRELRKRVGLRCHPEIDEMISEAEQGYEVACRYRYR